jgi:hypothetical protein
LSRFVVLAALWLSSHLAMDPASREPGGVDREGRKPSLVVRLPETAYAVGKPIVPAIEFRNRTDHDVTIWSCGFWPNHKVVVRDKEGREPPLTAGGEQRRRSFAPGGGRDKSAPILVKSGDDYQYCININIYDLYRLSPGRYELEVTYDDESPPSPLRLTSRHVEFVVR